MSFVTKEWKDRLAEFAGRRKLTNVSTGEETTVDVSRAEGEVSQAGDAFSAANMNDLEQRIKYGFDKVDSDLEWKLHKSVTGQEEVTLPSDYRELYIVISPFDPEVFMTYVIKSALSDSSKRFHLGSCTFYSQDSKVWAWSVDFSLSKAKFKLGDVTNNPGSGSYDRYNTSTVCTIYYR